jgi:glycosyltransferase involved in cell wall biosynthesis
MAPRYSVIIPTHGRPAFLADALASVLDQSLDDLEVIVVDDASPEPVVLPGDDPRLRLVRRSANGGPAAARNTGVDAAGGDRLAFLDDDDWWEPGHLARADARLAERPDREICVCWSRWHDGPATAGRLLEGDVGDTILDDITPHLGATVMSRAAWTPIDESYLGSEDVEWWLRTAAGHRVTTVAEHLHVVRRHDEVRTRHGATARAEGSRRTIEEHADWFRRHPRAAAFRWKRVGLQALAAGEPRAAAAALARSLRYRPDPGTARHLARAGLAAVSPRGAAPR